MCTAHLYGVALYYLTNWNEWSIGGVQCSRPEFLYFWVYYVGFNLPWAVVPLGESSSCVCFSLTSHLEGKQYVLRRAIETVLTRRACSATSRQLGADCQGFHSVTGQGGQRNGGEEAQGWRKGGVGFVCEASLERTSWISGL